MSFKALEVFSNLYLLTLLRFNSFDLHPYSMASAGLTSTISRIIQYAHDSIPIK